MPDIYRFAERMFGMDDVTWARHASPWSVWTRVATLPVLLLALYSHVWIGWWGAATAVVVSCTWIWLNPRLFPPPARTDTWSARATFGERIWLARHAQPVPKHHRTVPHVLSVVAGIGSVIGLVGAGFGAAWPTLIGAVLAYRSKLWFCDRMVWLFEDMRIVDPRVTDWMRIGQELNSRDAT